MKQKIRLTESQLHKIIRKCVNETLNKDWAPQNKLDKYKYNDDIESYPAYYDLLSKRYELDKLYGIYQRNPFGNPLVQDKILRLKKQIEKLEGRMRNYTPTHKELPSEKDYNDDFYYEFSDVPGVEDEE